MESTTEVIHNIANGEHDERINDLLRAVRERHKYVDAHNALDVKLRITKGDVVRIREDAALRPQYLLGTEWEVKKVNQKTAGCVSLDDHVKTTRYGRGQIRIPLSAVDVVNSQ